MDDKGPLKLNPYLKLKLFRRAGELVAVRVEAPVRGGPLRVVRIARDEEPLVLDLLARIASRAGPVDADVDAAVWDRLVDLGVLVAEGDVARPVRFHCSPLAPPEDLVPVRARGVRAPPLRKLRVTPSLRIVDGSAPFLAEGRAWVRVEHTDMPVPSLFSFRAAEQSFLLRLLPGRAPPELAPDLAASLALADILIEPESAERRHTAWAKSLADASERLRRDRYAVLRGVVHPMHLAALRRYYRELVAEGRLALGDEQVPRRHHAHNEPMARLIHQSLAWLVSALAGAPYKPSYVYLGAYLPGAALAPHRDREQCELSISLQVDYAPEPEDTTPWPIHVEGRPVSLGLGDALVYRGRELTHARDALPEGSTSTSVFFHYVPEGFTGPLD